MVSDKKILPFVSVIVVNWNGQHFLENLLPLLEKQTYPRDNFEVVLLDNNSTKDESVAFVSQNFPWVKLVENSKNDGFARGCNLAIAAAKGDYLVLLNNDTYPDRGWLAALVECALSEERAGAVVSKLLFANRGNGTIINNAGSTLHPDRAWPIEEIGANQPDGPEYSKRREVTAVCGASVLLNRKMLDDIGLFDESFFMYFEDTDLSWRGQKANWKFYYEPSSVLLHEHSGSSKEHSDFWTFYVTRNRLLVMYKNARLLLATRVYAAFIKEFMALPFAKLLLGRERRHQVHMLKLATKINLSFLARLPLALGRRLGFISERKLTS